MIAIDVSYDHSVVLSFLVMATQKYFLCTGNANLKRKYQDSVHSKITQFYSHHLTDNNFLMNWLLHCQCVS